MDIYTTKDVEKAIGIRTERFREWVVRGFIKPKCRLRGSGHPFLYGKEEIIKIAMFKKLLDAGLSRNATAKYLEHFKIGDVVTIQIDSREVAKDIEEILNDKGVF